MRPREEAPVAEEAAADPGAAAAAAAEDGAGGGGDVDSHRLPPDTENHCRALAVCALYTPHNLPLTSRGY